MCTLYVTLSSSQKVRTELKFTNYSRLRLQHSQENLELGVCLKHTFKPGVQRVNRGHWSPVSRRLKPAQTHLWFAATGDACPARPLPHLNPPADWWQPGHPLPPGAWLRQQCAPSWPSPKWSCREPSARPPTLPSAARPSPGASLHWQLPLQSREKPSSARDIWHTASWDWCGKCITIVIIMLRIFSIIMTVFILSRTQRNLVPQESSRSAEVLLYFPIIEVSNTGNDSCYFDSQSVLLYVQSFQISGPFYLQSFWTLEN